MSGGSKNANHNEVHFFPLYKSHIGPCTCTPRDSIRRDKVFVDNLHNKRINIKRFIPYFCVTFYSINIPISGFRRLNLPSEDDAVEKYIPTFSPG